MRALVPSLVEDVDVHEYYAADWVDSGGMRVNFIAAVDGAVTAAGLSRGLQTPGDNAVFAALRDLADVVLVGAGTALAEGYRAVQPSPARQAIRRKHGLAEALPIAVISRSLGFDPAAGLFTGASDAKTLVLTCTAADDDKRHRLEEVADVIDCGEQTVEPTLARRVLEERGYRRMLCEGGPNLFAQLVGAGVVDELCLSVSPMLGGPGAGRITDGTPWPELVRVQLVGLLEEDGALFGRYRFEA